MRRGLKSYTDEEEVFILLNAETMTIKEMAAEKNLSKQTVYNICIRAKIKFKKEPYVRTVQPPQSLPLFRRLEAALAPDPVKPKIVRPPAVYSNQTDFGYYLPIRERRYAGSL